LAFLSNIEQMEDCLWFQIKKGSRPSLGMDVVELRRRVGMVFHNCLTRSRSIFDNVAYGLRINGMHSKQEPAEKVDSSLQAAVLWNEVKDRLKESSFGRPEPNRTTVIMTTDY
jgi:ABC-type phosphate transport system ATPase subunit